MITRQTIWIIGVLAVASGQYVPYSSVGDDNDCALYLSGPGRTSAFDYNLNLLRGSFPYDGQHTCITYDAVNQAYIDARKRINVASPKGDWKTEDIASVGELMLDISINLARTYGLTYEDVEKGLPLIDTSKTLIREVCPPFLSNVECRAGKYRRFDGLCTNLQHPTWGATMTPFQRLIAPLYSDGINAPRMSVTGNELPLSRVVSRTMHPDEGFHDHAGTVMVIAWGQFMDHDYTLTATPLDPFNRNDPEECCNRPPNQKHPYCNELRIPDDDYFFRLFNIKCIDFVRGFPSPREGCRLGSRQQFNTLTGVLDGNTVYGVTEKFSRKLRSGYGGLLRMNPVFEEYGLKDLLPLKLDYPDEGCTRPNKSMFCFEAGEIRVNEQLVLTCMHTLMAREHNRAARGLAEVNPHWDDETLFQEARRIVIAEIQHITYNEFLPILLGKEVMEKFGLLLQKDGYWDGYDEHINPNVIDAFSAAAFRFGHSLLPTAIERWSKAHKFISSKRLSDLIRRPQDLYRAGIFDEYLMGLMNQVAQAMDDSITQEVTNHLFKKPGARFGMDLVSFNMQRGREFGLPGYMEFRKFCGLPEVHNFHELSGSMTNETIHKYESLFEHPSDVDLWSAGVSERPLPGSMLGPTFACIIATQFSYSRRGDRFWYELPNQPSSFTPEQLIELRKARLSRVICDNTDIIDTVQVYPMVLPDHEINPRVPCRSGIIPSIDFSKWADYSNHHNPYVQNNETVQNSTVKNDKYTQNSKNIGHYKNSLRRRRSINNATVPIDKISKTNDSQTAAVVVNQVTGIDANEEDKATTENIVPLDRRSHKSPQKFDLQSKHEQRFYNNPYYDYEEQVNEEDEENVEDEEEYSDKFVPDDSKNQEIEPEEPKRLDHGDEEDIDNGGIARNADLEQQNVGESHTEADSNIYDDEEHRHKCFGTERTSNSAESDQHNDESVRRDCDESGSTLERIEEQEDDSNSTEQDDHGISENLKEQFEFIPLTYLHYNVTNQPKDVLKPSKIFDFDVNIEDSTLEIENITLPDTIFGLYKSGFNENLDNKTIEEENENDDDNDDESESLDEDDENNEDESNDKDIDEFVPGYAKFDSLIFNKDNLKQDDSKNKFDYYIEDPELKSNIAEIVDKSKKTEDESGSVEDPKYNYFWTLEYGQPKN